MNEPRDAGREGLSTITVKVTLFADLRRFLPKGADGPQPCTLGETATVADLLASLGVPADTELTAAVDGELASPNTPLRDGSEVMLLSPMEGGAAAQGEAPISIDGPVLSPLRMTPGAAAADGEAPIAAIRSR